MNVDDDPPTTDPADPPVNELTPGDDPEASLGSMPDHEPGSLTAWTHGCRRHHACRFAGARWKAGRRAELRKGLVYQLVTLPDGTEEFRWVNELLAPADQIHISARHGTAYGRGDFGCDCPLCEVARRIPPDEENPS